MKKDAYKTQCMVSFFDGMFFYHNVRISTKIKNFVFLLLKLKL